MWRQTLNIIISSILVLFSIACALSQAGGALLMRVDITVCFDDCNGVNMTTTWQINMEVHLRSKVPSWFLLRRQKTWPLALPLSPDTLTVSQGVTLTLSQLMRLLSFILSLMHRPSLSDVIASRFGAGVSWPCLKSREGSPATNDLSCPAFQMFTNSDEAVINKKLPKELLLRWVTSGKPTRHTRPSAHCFFFLFWVCVNSLLHNFTPTAHQPLLLIQPSAERCTTLLILIRIQPPNHRRKSSKKFSFHLLHFTSQSVLESRPVVKSQRAQMLSRVDYTPSHLLAPPPFAAMLQSACKHVDGQTKHQFRCVLAGGCKQRVK